MERNGKWLSRTNRSTVGWTPEEKMEAAQILADLERQGYDPEAVVQGIRNAIAAHPNRRPTLAEVKEAVRAEELVLEEKRHREWLESRPKLPDARPRSLRWFLWALVTWLRWPIFEAGQRIMYFDDKWPWNPGKHGKVNRFLWWVWARATARLGYLMSGRFWHQVDACFERVTGCDVDTWLEDTIQDREAYPDRAVERVAATAWETVNRNAPDVPYPLRRATARQIKQFAAFELKRRDAEVRSAMWKHGPEGRAAR